MYLFTARHLRISGSMEQNPFLKLTTDQLLKKSVSLF
jgi:hypothetical protein